MPAYAKKFNYTQSTSAEGPYLKLIGSSNITLTRRQHLRTEYDTFKANEAKQYWESVQFKLSLKSTARKAATSTAEAGLYELQAEYSTYKEGSGDHASECIDLSPSSVSQVNRRLLPTGDKTTSSSSLPPIASDFSMDRMPNNEVADDTKIFISESQFDENDDVDNCKAAFKRYTSSLLAISQKQAINKVIRICAKEARDVRESHFRTHYFKKDSEIVQAAANRKRPACDQDHPSKQSRYESDEESDDTCLHLDLLNNNPIPSDPDDTDYLPSSQPSSQSSQYDSESSNEDLTGELFVPVKADHLVGPGTFSSQLTDDLEGRLIVEDLDISDSIMKYRRKRVIKEGLLEKDDLL
ncbi:hypothetical protein BGZ80_009495 [Entomortierella chlamydospora]|uniref:Uncharacterized protein n=1 Tax=Entomortierella chlamydospora TaxID=101097 RepID=A0A9P6T0L8_9FUNG|nr:hypothetical protein BGZ79_008039 [Entomortierella chlamydospora]KAG0016006.1 hypothetical protein BGZ80_009495 [Entomortierella chlamydospora]